MLAIPHKSRNRPPSLRFDQLELLMSMFDVLFDSPPGPARPEGLRACLELHCVVAYS
jgi:hypothetical protein